MCVCDQHVHAYTYVCARTGMFHKHAGMFVKMSLGGLTGDLNSSVVLGACICGCGVKRLLVLMFWGCVF